MTRRLSTSRATTPAAMAMTTRPPKGALGDLFEIGFLPAPEWAGSTAMAGVGNGLCLVGGGADGGGALEGGDAGAGDAGGESEGVGAADGVGDVGGGESSGGLGGGAPVCRGGPGGCKWEWEEGGGEVRGGGAAGGVAAVSAGVAVGREDAGDGEEAAQAVVGAEAMNQSGS